MKASKIAMGTWNGVVDFGQLCLATLSIVGVYMSLDYLGFQFLFWIMALVCVLFGIREMLDEG